jgi:hypothetical protein
MQRAARIRGRIDGDRLVARDRGVSYIEVLVSVVLLGTAVVAILAAVRATVIASRIDSEDAKAHAWAQAAADNLGAAPRVSCAVTVGAVDPVSANDPTDWEDNRGTTGVADSGTVWTEYEAVVDPTPPPSAWAGATIEIASIEFLGRSSIDSGFDWSPDLCFEGVQEIDGSVEDFRQSSVPSQRITIEVRGPDGQVLATTDVVKGAL